MDKGLKKNGTFLFILVLVFITFLVIFLDWQSTHRKLTFAMLDIGQGDALFIESPSGTQIFFDGGPAKKISNVIGEVLPTFDKTIDALVITNPDADHMSGFLYILQNYKVGQVFESGTTNDSETYKKFKEEIKKQNIKSTIVTKGMRLHIGGGAYIDILFPDRDVSTWERNDGSIVARLVYGESTIMLTGDTTEKVERIILENNNLNNLQSDILKVAHHGSRTSTSYDFVNTVNPKYALISNGLKNNYGHPHPEVLDILNSLGVKILRTDTLGTIVFTCDRIKECKQK